MSNLAHEIEALKSGPAFGASTPSITTRHRRSRRRAAALGSTFGACHISGFGI